MSDLRDKRQGANDPIVGKAALPEGLLRQRMAPYSNRPGGAEKRSRQRPAPKSEADWVQRKRADTTCRRNRMMVPRSTIQIATQTR